MSSAIQVSYAEAQLALLKSFNISVNKAFALEM